MTSTTQDQRPGVNAAVVKATVLWAAIGILAAVNGVVRDTLLEPALGPTLALTLSGLMLSVLVLLVTYGGSPWYKSRSTPFLVGIGVYWLVLTILFESGLGLLVSGQTWEQVLRQYTFAEGNLWVLVLTVITVAPWLTDKVRRQV
ncbi:hypothetical protein HC341_08795 [Aquisalimonas sp. 2447]|uniref:hypothetical protein n=1 Tax=Aquisalimonas sp. 2447 TaxID=2740807 RepID=UPI0014327D9C|nr:hypothetical protein [Aquisalimonas sp. 2447]QIT55292.1 hypothetical protein HC341_08795 [Aquisalimonas sp. 2447]